MINIDNKSYILDKYYNEHEKPTIIAKELNVNSSYITKIIKKDARYEQEKEYRTQISKENRKIAKRDTHRLLSVSATAVKRFGISQENITRP